MRGFFSDIKLHAPFLLFLSISFIYIFSPFHYEEGAITADAVFDAQIARNILLGDGLGWQATLQPPFQAILTSAISLIIGNILISGVLVSKLMWWFLPIPVYLLTKEIFLVRTALISAVLVFFHPHFSSSGMEPTTTYSTLLLLGVSFSWIAFTRKSFFYSILGGLFFSFSYLARSEGLLIFLFSFACMVLIFIKELTNKRDTRKVLILLVLLVSFILASLPYVLFLKDTYGKIVLSPKSTYVQIWMKWKIYHDNNLGEQGNPDLWGLSKNGKLMWQEPKGIGDLVQYLTSQPEKSLRVYLENFSRQIPGRIPNNSGQWLYPQVYPWYFVIPAIFWVVVSFTGREKRRETMFLLSPFAILFVLPVFSDGWWKYLLPYATFLIILAVAGFSNICERFHWRHLLPAAAIVIVIYSLWTVKASPLVKHGDQSVTARGAMLQEQKKAGEWAQKRFKGVPNYMVQWSKLAYYLNGRWTAMPVTDYYGMVWYARKNKVDYIVFETSGKGDSEDIVRDMGNMPDLKVADIYESPERSYGVVFLELKK